MIIHPPTGIPVSSFERLRENAQWLRDFLTQRNVKIHSSSVLHQAIYVSENLPDWSFPDLVQQEAKKIARDAGVNLKCIGKYTVPFRVAHAFTNKGISKPCGSCRI